MAPLFETDPETPPLISTPTTLLMSVVEIVPLLVRMLLLFTVTTGFGEAAVPAPVIETVTPELMITSSAAPLLTVAVCIAVDWLEPMVVVACATPAGMQKGARATAAIRVLRIRKGSHVVKGNCG